MGAHLDALDGLRGCMAMVVLLRHAFNAVDLPDATRLAVMQSPLALLQSAQAAIHVFFVMSAFVLARSLARDRSASGVAQYAVKRFFRLHPPYVAGLLLTWLAAFFYVSDPATEEWVRYFAGIHLTVPELLASFSFPGDARMQLPVGWSLRVEMIGSLLLPLILLAAVARVLPLLAAAALVVYLHPEAVWLRWLPDFALGVALYARREALGTAFARMPSWGRALCVAAGWFLFCAPLLLGWTEPGLGLVLAGFDRRAMAVNSLGAAVIVATCVWTPASARFFSWRPPTALGRWAYGIYMLHFTAVILLAPYFPAGLGDYALLSATVTAVVVPTSALLHGCVELPSIRLGNRVCRILALRLGAQTVRSELAD